METNDTFAADVLQKVDMSRPFEPQVFYDQDGDCIEFLATNEPFRRERIDALLTVFYGRETGEITGSLIKGIRRLVRDITEKMPGFKIEVRDGEIRLEYLFLARMWLDELEDCQEGRALPCKVVTYQKLREVAGTTGVTARLCFAD